MRFDLATSVDSAPSDIPQEKICSRCKVSLPINQFHRNKNMRDGRSPACKACSKSARQAGPASTYKCVRCDTESVRKTFGAQKYCPDCASAVRRERDRARRPRTKVGFPRECERCEVEFTYRGGKQVVCPDCVKFVNVGRGRRWAEANPDKRLAIAKAYNDKRRSTPKGHLEWTMRAAVKRAIKKDTKAGRRTFELLGYTVEELKSHLERQFLDDMSWDNYGRWHIDHRVPLASFNYETPDCPEFKAAWAVTNLQPLWGADNLSKGAKRLVLV